MYIHTICISQYKNKMNTKCICHKNFVNASLITNYIYLYCSCVSAAQMLLQNLYQITRFVIIRVTKGVSWYVVPNIICAQTGASEIRASHGK